MLEGAAPIRPNDFGRQWRAIEADVQAAVAEVGARGWYILGEEVRAFERALAEAWRIPQAIGVGSGLDALEICLRCLGIGPGTPVLTTPLSAFATSLAVIRLGAVPVFVDVDAGGQIDLDLCRDVLRGRSDLRVLLPVHLYGHALDLEGLAALRDELDLTVIEDCAQSIGASSGGRPTGSVGRMAATSFYPTKNLGALGDAGAVLTADWGLAERARGLRHYGQSRTYVHDHIGLNSRLDELHAAILHRAMLPRLQEWTARRNAIATRYRAGIRNPHLTLPPPPPGSVSVWHLFPVLATAAERPSFIDHLARAGVMTGIHYPRLIPDQGAMREHGRFEVAGRLDNARRFAEGEVSLPIHPYLADEEVDRVIEACNAWQA